MARKEGIIVYCETCKRLFEQDRCPLCDRPGRAAEETDFCLVSEQSNPVFAGILEDVLRQEHIPVFKKSRMGAWMTALLGSGSDITELYVPYAALERARALEASLFAGEGEPQDAPDEG